MNQVTKTHRRVKRNYTTDTWAPERAKYWAPCDPNKTTDQERARCIKRLAADGIDTTTLTSREA